MRDYAELIARLKQSDDNCNAECCECSGECLSSGCNIFSEAADAIEELLARDVVPTDFHERCLQLEIRKRIELEKQMPHWISVEERLPDDWKPVLAYDPIGYGEIGIAFIIGSLNTVVWRGVGFTNTAYPPGVTHWMPLPEPPKEVE